jgi:hypothetical protein
MLMIQTNIAAAGAQMRFVNTKSVWYAYWIYGPSAGHRFRFQYAAQCEQEVRAFVAES